jgi:tRNA modification GTPase
VHLELEGYPVTLLDTAGIRDSAEPVEQEGIRRARERAASADLLLWVTDVSADDRSNRVPPRAEGASFWLIENKIDLLPSEAKTVLVETPNISECEFIFSISATKGEGLDAFVSALSRFAADAFAGGEAALVTRARHRHALEETTAAIGRALTEAAAKDSREELIAEELRRAATSLGRLTGRVDVEDVLDVIFRDFCIGK